MNRVSPGAVNVKDADDDGVVNLIADAAFDSVTSIARRRGSATARAGRSAERRITALEKSGCITLAARYFPRPNLYLWQKLAG